MKSPSGARTAEAAKPFAKAMIKSSPEDWIVHEQLPLDPSPEGEHLFLQIEKRELSTAFVAQWLADYFSIALMDVGYAGLKDKHAVTWQWFSIRLPSAGGIAQGSLYEGDGGGRITLLDQQWRLAKLGRGEHRANRFQIRLREVTGLSATALALEAAITEPFPNYFGPQRFGRENLDRALNWLKNRRHRRVAKSVRGWHLSVIRSWLFNEILRVREEAGCWKSALAGDVLNDGDDVPTGSLWGRGRSPLSGEALVMETRALASFASECDALEQAGVKRGLRPLVIKPRIDTVEVCPAGGDIRLAFELPPGAYATSFLAQHFDLTEPSR